MATLPDQFPSGTTFAIDEGIPLTKAPGWVVRAWDGAEPRRYSIADFMFASPVDEARFRAAVLASA